MTDTARLLCLCISLTISSTKLHPTSKDPLSKIVITSKEAFCKKDGKDASRLRVEYKGDVQVELASYATAHAQTLSVVVMTDKLKSTGSISKGSETPFKEITLEKDVVVKAKNRTVRADKAIIYPQTKQCLVTGNVLITQHKMGPDDIPMTTKSDELLLDLSKELVTLSGNKHTPVHTVITLSETNFNTMLTTNASHRSKKKSILGTKKESMRS